MVPLSSVPTLAPLTVIGSRPSSTQVSSQAKSSQAKPSQENESSQVEQGKRMNDPESAAPEVASAEGPPSEDRQRSSHQNKEWSYADELLGHAQQHVRFQLVLGRPAPLVQPQCTIWPHTSTCWTVHIRGPATRKHSERSLHKRIQCPRDQHIVGVGRFNTHQRKSFLSHLGCRVSLRANVMGCFDVRHLCIHTSFLDDTE